MEISEKLKISDERLEQLCAKIKPVVRYATVSYGGKSTCERHSEGDLYYIEDVNPRNVAFTWDPKPKDEAIGLKELSQIKTFHTYGYQGFFKPSIAEVLAQIPDSLLERTVAFETVSESVEFEGQYHLALTRLYSR